MKKTQNDLRDILQDVANNIISSQLRNDYNFTTDYISTLQSNIRYIDLFLESLQGNEKFADDDLTRLRIIRLRISKIVKHYYDMKDLSEDMNYYTDLYLD